MFNSICLFQFYSPGASIIMSLHYYHIMLDFCEMNSVFERIFSSFAFRKVFVLGFLLVAKYLFSVRQKYPAPLIPICSEFVKSNPWVRSCPRTALAQSCPLHTSSLIELYTKVCRPCFKALWFLTSTGPCT